MADGLGVLLGDLERSIREGIRVSVVATVRDYDATAQTLTAIPLVAESRTVAGRSVTVAPAPIEGVPVIWPSGGGRSLTWGIDDGDLVILLIRTSSHDDVDAGRVSSTPAAPPYAHRMSYADAIALPGFVAPDDSDGQGRSDGQPTLAMQGGDALHVGGSGATYSLVRSDLLESHFAAIETYMTALLAYIGSASPTAPPPGTFPALTTIKTDRIKVDQ